MPRRATEARPRGEIRLTTRRELLMALGAAALAAPIRSFAQPQGKLPRIGLLSLATNGTGFK